MRSLSAIALAGAFALVSVGCGSSGGEPMTAASSNEDSQNKKQSAKELRQATPAELEAASVACPANAKGRVKCVHICHVPPGNPNAARTLLIPMEAVPAHLNHGPYRGTAT